MAGCPTANVLPAGRVFHLFSLRSAYDLPIEEYQRPKGNDLKKYLSSDYKLPA